MMIRKQFDDFTNKYTSIENYFGIHTDPDSTLHMKLFQTGVDTLLFRIEFQKPNTVHLDELCQDVHTVIDAYLQTRIYAEFELAYPDSYPFKPPTWSLVLLRHTLPLDLKEHYEYLVNNHNDQNNLDWSPAIRIEKDILEFLQTFMKHFHYLYDKK